MNPEPEQNISYLLDQVEPLESNVKPLSRMTATLMLHHERHGRQPVTYTPFFSRILRGAESAVSYEITVDSHWKSLQHGRIPMSSVSLLLIVNLEGGQYLTHPTEAERADVMRRVVHLARSYESDNVWQIAPQMFHLGCPSNVDELLVCCPHQRATCQVVLIPE